MKNVALNVIKRIIKSFITTFLWGTAFGTIVRSVALNDFIDQVDSAYEEFVKKPKNDDAKKDMAYTMACFHGCVSIERDGLYFESREAASDFIADLEYSLETSTVLSLFAVNECYEPYEDSPNSTPILQPDEEIYDAATRIGWCYPEFSLSKNRDEHGAFKTGFKVRINGEMWFGE